MSQVYIGSKEYFPEISRIRFEGRDSDNPLSFKFYDEGKVVAGKAMKEHLRFAVAYWHTLTADGSDPFGAGTLSREWNNGGSGLEKAEKKADAAFEFITKLGAPYYCFHDVDAAPDAEDVAEYEDNVAAVTEMLLERQNATGVKLLWNTANLFSHPRYMNGAATNPEFDILARGAVQVKAMLEANVKLGEKITFSGEAGRGTPSFSTPT